VNSRYFTVDEFRCHDGTPYPSEWVDDRLAALCETLDAIREAWGGPLHVVSGYRTPEFNARLSAKSTGVAQSSQHIQGRAADIRPSKPTPEAVETLHSAVKSLYGLGKLPKLGGIGLYPGWIHVDVRAKVNGHLATWTGAGVGSEK
jgi:uncharacterized protein YcbK (DUF882 family)